MGGHKGLDLHVLLLPKQLLHHLNVTVRGVPHQNQVGCQALLDGTLGILTDPLEVRANLDGKNNCKLLCCFKIVIVNSTVKWERDKIKLARQQIILCVTSSVMDMRLKACMAASCTDNVVAGCLMHFSRVALIAGSAASMASPMLPITCHFGLHRK